MKRLSISVEDKVYDTLLRLSKKNFMSLSGITRRVLNEFIMNVYKDDTTQKSI